MKHFLEDRKNSALQSVWRHANQDDIATVSFIPVFFHIDYRRIS
jgi:hypothetical protein